MRRLHRLGAALIILLLLSSLCVPVIASASSGARDDLYRQNPPVNKDQSGDTAVIPVEGHIIDNRSPQPSPPLSVKNQLTIFCIVTGQVSSPHSFYICLSLNGSHFEDITLTVDGTGTASQVLSDIPAGQYSMKEFKDASRTMELSPQNSIFTVTYSSDATLTASGSGVLTVTNHGVEAPAPTPVVSTPPAPLVSHDPAGESSLTVYKRVVGDVDSSENTFWLALLKDGATYARFSLTVTGVGEASQTFAGLPDGTYALAEYADSGYTTYLSSRNSTFTPLYSPGVVVMDGSVHNRLIVTNSTDADYIPDDYVPVNRPGGQEGATGRMPYTGGFSLSLIAIPGALILLIGLILGKRRKRRQE